MQRGMHQRCLAAEGIGEIDIKIFVVKQCRHGFGVVVANRSKDLLLQRVTPGVRRSR